MKYALYIINGPRIPLDTKVQVDFNRNPSGKVLFWADCFYYGTGPAMPSPEEAVKALLKNAKLKEFTAKEWERWEVNDARQSVGDKKRRTRARGRHGNLPHPKLRQQNPPQRLSLEGPLSSEAPIGA